MVAVDAVIIEVWFLQQRIDAIQNAARCGGGAMSSSFVATTPQGGRPIDSRSR